MSLMHDAIMKTVDTKKAKVCYTYKECLPMQWTTHAHRVRICCHNTHYVHVNGHDRAIFIILAKHCTKLPDDGSSVIRNMSEHF